MNQDRVAAEYTGKGIRVIERSRAIPASPLVRGPGSDEGIIEAITRALTSRSAGHDSLRKGWDAEFQYGFRSVSDSLYMPILEYINKES